MSSVATVTGEVAASELGLTLMHEHLLINQMREQRRIGLVNDVDMIVDDVAAFVACGGRTIVDLTVAELARGASPDPTGRLAGQAPDDDLGVGSARPASHVRALVDVARRTGVQLVLGTGHYREPYLDRDWFDRHSPDQIAEELVRDLTEGIPGTDGVRAGIIGEIGANEWYISAAEERSFRAAARAHHRTGAVVTTHAARWPVGLPQLDLLCGEEDVAPERVVIGHVDTVRCPVEYALELAGRGAWVQFDNLRSTRRADLDRLAADVGAFVRAGRAGQLLLSHDLCTTEDWPAGGGVGLTHLPTTVRHHFREAGLGDDVFEQLLVDNPRRAFTGQGS